MTTYLQFLEDYVYTTQNNHTRASFYPGGFLQEKKKRVRVVWTANRAKKASTKKKTIRKAVCRYASVCVSVLPLDSATQDGPWDSQCSIPS